MQAAICSGYNRTLLSQCLFAAACLGRPRDLGSAVDNGPVETIGPGIAVVEGAGGRGTGGGGSGAI